MLIRLLRTQLRPYRRPVALVVLLQLIQTLATLYLPTLNADIIDNGVIKGDTSYIIHTGGIMMAVAVVQIACLVGAVYLGARTAMAVGRDLRQAVFSRVMDFSAREVGRFGTPSLITRTTNDVQQVQMLTLMTFTMMVSAPIICVGGIVLALNQDVTLSSLLLVAVPLLAIIVGLIIWRMRPLFRLMQERIDGINSVLREQITGVRVIRAFVRDGRERERFAGSSTGLLEVGLGTGRLMALMFPSVMLVLNVSSVAVLWFGGHLVASGAMQIGSLTAAQARDFVEQMPGGLEAKIAQGGTNVSGGQRQRLAIARALVHRPEIYLFDDSFSALDYATDAELRAALARETTDATVIIVAQRVSTIRHADTIVVFDAGRVVATGTHDELMSTDETYREIVLSQLTEQEAA